MRKNFVLFALIPFVIISVVVYLFIDSWVESGLEYAGEKAVGAKVEIDRLRLSINPIGIEFSRLQIANPSDGWKNLCETGKVKFALNFGQLLRGKFIIETMEMNNLILGTKRTTDGSLPKEPKKPEAAPSAAAGTVAPPPASIAPAQKPASSMPTFDIDKIKKSLNYDSLLNPNNLATLKRIELLKQQVNETSAQWQTSLTEYENSKSTLNDIETRVQSINLGNIKDLQSANDALNNAKTILNSANDVKNTFDSRKTTLTDGVNQLGGSFNELDNLATQDFKNVVGLARLPDVSMKGLAEMVLGKDLLVQAYKYLGYADMAKSAIQNSSDKPPIEAPKRLKGQTIHFPAEHAYPKFWIKKILITGGTDKAQDPQYFYAKGEILNISNDQRITGLPITVDLSATKGEKTTLALRLTFDRRKDPGVDNYIVSLTGLPVDDMSLGQSDFLPSKVSNAIADAAITVEVPGNQFDSHAKITMSNMTVVFDRPASGLVEQIVHNVLASIKGFHVDLRMWKNAESFDVAFATDLDDQLASRTREVIGAEVAKIQREIRAKVDAAIAEKRAEAEKLFNEKRDLVMGKIKEYENLANEKLAMADAKKREIEDRVNQEKNKQVDDAKKKAEDAVKGLIRRF